jgi:hypothetical protein
VCVPLLDDVEFARLVRGVLDITPTQAKALDLEHQIRIALWEWLFHLGSLSDAVRELIVNAMESAIRGYCEVLQHCVRSGKLDKSEMPVFTMQIADNRYAAWHREEDWLDLRDRRYISQLPQPAVTLVICDFSGLYCRLNQRLTELRSRTDAGTKPQQLPGDVAAH